MKRCVQIQFTQWLLNAAERGGQGNVRKALARQLTIDKNKSGQQPHNVLTLVRRVPSPRNTERNVSAIEYHLNRGWGKCRKINKYINKKQK